MATALRGVAHDDRLSLVEHLDELRTRLIVSALTLVVAFGVCAWQNNAILHIINAPLEQTAFKQNAKTQDPFERQAVFQQEVKRTSLAKARRFDRLAVAAETANERELLRGLAADERAQAAAVPPRQARKPVTLGVGEPFTQTLKVAGYAALLIALPLILYQLYAFILPAFSPRERQVALPLMAAVPFLFIGGVVFAYFAVLPSTVDFLQNFNDDQYDILLQARDYYGFAVMVLIVMGLGFQVPIGLLAITRVGIVSVDQLRHSRRYALVVMAILAALLPGQDPVTLGLVMVPMYALFEGSILLAALLDRRARRAEMREADEVAQDAALVSRDRDD